MINNLSYYYISYLIGLLHSNNYILLYCNILNYILISYISHSNIWLQFNIETYKINNIQQFIKYLNFTWLFLFSCLLRLLFWFTMTTMTISLSRKISRLLAVVNYIRFNKINIQLFEQDIKRIFSIKDEPILFINVLISFYSLNVHL